ncbi:PIN domain nuclease, partial [Salmonella enterica subsp. enterica serovar Typhimurium]
GGLGLFVGLVIAFFASNALSQTNIPLLNSVVPVILTLVLGYLGFRIGISRRSEFGNFVNNRNAKKKTAEEEQTEEKSKKTYKILDTSV